MRNSSSSSLRSRRSHTSPLSRSSCRVALGGLFAGGLLAIACGGTDDQPGGFTTGTAGAGTTKGGSAPTAGSNNAAGTAASAGGAAGSSRGGATSTGGGAGTASGGNSSGAAGVATMGGSGGTATDGKGGSGGTTTGGSTTGGSGGSTTGGSGGGSNANADQCKPIGWATRSGRGGGGASVTGGGNASPIVVKTFADLDKYATDDQPRVIHIDGTVGSGWSGKSGDRLEIHSNKTIVGLRAGTQLKAAIHINDATNVILRNIVVRGPGSNGDQAWDNINIEGDSKNVWVDHAEFWDGQDGNADVVKGADNVTFTWSIFGYTKNNSHNLSNLIASSDNEPVSDGKLDITFMFNWWRGAAQRQPRCRYGEIHVVNNLYTEEPGSSPSELGVSNGFKCSVLTENNHFIDQNEPIDLGKQAGDGSVQETTGNLFEGCSGNQKGSGKAFTPPYEYKSFMVPAEQVKALVQKYAGATLSSPTACAR